MQNKLLAVRMNHCYVIEMTHWLRLHWLRYSDINPINTSEVLRSETHYWGDLWTCKHHNCVMIMFTLSILFKLLDDACSDSQWMLGWKIIWLTSSIKDECCKSRGYRHVWLQNKSSKSSVTTFKSISGQPRTTLSDRASSVISLSVRCCS